MKIQEEPLTFGRKGDFMISFEPFWNTLKAKNITTYKLITQYGVSKGQLSRIRNNANVNTHTIDMLCTILDCRVEDVMEYRQDNAASKS